MRWIRVLFVVFNVCELCFYGFCFVVSVDMEDCVVFVRFGFILWYCSY